LVKVIISSSRHKYKPLYHWLVKVIISGSRYVCNGEIQTSVSLTGGNNCISPLKTCLPLEIITFTSQWYGGLYFSIGNMFSTRNLVEIIISSSRHVSNGEIQTSVSLTDDSNYF
jgi:hypothetical protein